MANKNDEATLVVTSSSIAGINAPQPSDTPLDMLKRFAADKSPKDLQPALLAAVQAGWKSQVNFYVKEKNVDVNADYLSDVLPQKLLYIAWRNRERNSAMYPLLLKLGAQMSQKDLDATNDLEFVETYKKQNTPFLPPKSTGPRTT